MKNQRTIEEYSYGRCLARAAAAHASVDRPREISAAAAAAAHQQGARRDDRAPSLLPPQASSRDEAQAAAGGSGVWWGPPLCAEDEHAVIVAALAHVVGEGRQAQQQPPPPPVLGHGQQGTHVLAHGPTCSALRFCFLLFLIFEILASLLVVLSVDELIFFLNE